MVGESSLKYLAEKGEEGIKKATIFKIDPYKVEFEDGFNIRDDNQRRRDHLERMYVAMKSGHYMPPIDVKVVDGRILCRDGHGRTVNARRLCDEGVPYVLEARQVRGNEVDDSLHMLGAGEGLSYTPLEQGRAFMRLIRYGLTIQEICDRTGLSRTTIESGLALAESPVEVQQMISSGLVSAHVAVETLRKHGGRAAQVLSALVDKAKNVGASKVTARMIRPRAKIVDSVVARLRDSSLSGIEARPDEEEIQVTLTVGQVRGLLCMER